MTKKQKIVLIIFCAFLALLLIGTLIGTAALLLSGNTHGLLGEWLSGYANELRDHAKEASIEERWDVVMQNKDEYVSKIVIVSSVFYPYWSSEVSILSDRSIENTEEVHQVIDMFSHQEVSFDKLPDEMDGIHAYLESKDSQKYMQILFLDKQENIILGVCIYEDNSAAIVEGTTLSDGRTYTYSANFSSLLFESIEAIYQGIE